MTFQQHFSYNTFVKFIHRSVTKQRQRLHNTFMIASQPASQPSAIHNPPFQPIIIMGHNQIITIIIINYSSPTQLASVAHKWELDSLALVVSWNSNSNKMQSTFTFYVYVYLRYDVKSSHWRWRQRQVTTTIIRAMSSFVSLPLKMCIVNVFHLGLCLSLAEWMTVWNISSYMKHTLLW